LPFTAIPRRIPSLLVALVTLVFLAFVLLFGAAGARAEQRGRSLCTTHAHSHGCSKRTPAKHKSKHKAKHHKAKHHTSKPKPAPKPAPKQEPLEPAVCEDGSAPVAEDGAFSCTDGSEPVCEDGAEPQATHASTKLECSSNPEIEGETFGEEEDEGECESEECVGGQQTRPVCEDGSTSSWSKLGYYICRVGEPTCESGDSPTFSTEGNILYCEPGGE
jgi:hypothetical protein